MALNNPFKLIQAHGMNADDITMGLHHLLTSLKKAYMSGLSKLY
jgi:hypothetical protein